MSLVHIENLGSAGIITDTKPYALPQEAWSGGNNVRFLHGKAEKFAGQTATLGTLLGVPHAVVPWADGTSQFWLYPSAEISTAPDTKVWRTDGTTHIDVTRGTTTTGDNPYDAGVRPTWTGGVLGGVPILNHDNLGVDAPQSWDDTNTRFKDLPNWPANTWCKVMRPFKQYLVAYDITKSSTRYPYMVKWSHLADPGTVPTSWDETDPTVQAGENTLSESSGYVVDALPLGDTNIVYKEDATWGMVHVGGTFIWRFFQILSTSGLIAPRAVKEFQRKHFAVTLDDVILFNGQEAQSLISSRNRKALFQTIDTEYYDKTFVAPNYPEQEMWICFVETGSSTGFCSKAFVWNWAENHWTFRDLPEVTHIGFGVVPTTAQIETFDASSGSIDTDTGKFDSRMFSPVDRDLVLAQADSTFGLHRADVGYTFDGTGYLSYLERTGLQIVRPQVDPSSRKFIRRVWPKIRALSSITFDIYVGSQEDLDGAVSWGSAIEFDPTVQDYIDCMVNTRYICIRIEDRSTDKGWWLDGYSLDVDIVGGL